MDTFCGKLFKPLKKPRSGPRKFTQKFKLDYAISVRTDLQVASP